MRKTDIMNTILPKRAAALLAALLFPGVFAVAAATPSERTPEIATVRQMDGKIVGVWIGSLLELAAKERIRDPQLSYYEDITTTVPSLRTHKIDVALTTRPQAWLLLEKTPDLAMSRESLGALEYAAAFRPGDPLRDEFDSHQEALRAEGVLAEMARRWFEGTAATRTMPPDLPASSGENGVLAVFANNVSEPFSYVGADGSLTGFDIELVLRIAARMGRRADFTGVGFPALIPSLMSGKCDMIIGSITVTDERRKQVDFATPYHASEIVGIVRGAAAAAPASGWSDLGRNFYSNFIFEDRYKLVLDGVGVTLAITVAAAALGSILGFAVCFMRRSRRRSLNLPAMLFIRVIQGTPVLVVLMILYYIVFGSWNINGIYVAIVGFGLNFAAYVSEMMRSALDAVDPGQMEAARAMGFGRAGALSRIVFPQAARHMLPVFKGELVSMLKMTSIVGYIAIQDLTRATDIIRSRTYQAFFPLIVTAAIYFVLAYLFVYILNRIEFGLDPKRRARVVKGVNAR